MQQGTIAIAVCGDTNNGRLDKVMEATEERAKHPSGSHDPDGRVRKLAL